MDTLYNTNLNPEKISADKSEPGRDWFTPSETAGRLGVTEQHLARLRCMGGSPPFVKIGRSVRYHVPTLNGWLAERMQRSTSDLPRGDRVMHRPTARDLTDTI